MDDATQTDAAPRKPKTRKQRLRVHFSPELVAQMLGLPSEHHLVAVESTNDPLGLMAIVEGPDFPETPIEAESPYGQFHQTVHRDADTGAVIHVERKLTWFGDDGFRRGFES